jgi:hypothetical protein
MRPRVLVAAAAGVLLGCSDMRFDTQATYRAPVGGFDVSIHATGIVRAGADLSEESTADVHIRPLAGGRPLDIRVSLPKTADAPDVADLVRRAGYEVPHEESEEVNRVVDLALRGSKATLVQGQTKALRVVDVRFRYP